MSRYAYPDELTDLLTSVSLLALGATEAAQAPFLAEDLEAGETEVETRTDRVFVPFAQQVRVLSGRNTAEIRLPDAPIVDVASVQVGVDGSGVGYTIQGTDLRVERRSGRVSVRSTLTIAGAAPLAYMAYFPRGDNNLVVNYRAGFTVIGSNVGAAALAAAQVPDVATVTTVGATTYFDLPRATACWKKSGDALVSVRAPLSMQKTLNGITTDDSANWTLVSPRRLSIPTASYSATAQYLFGYVPHAIGQAALKFAAASTLRNKAIRDAAGSAGGVISRSAGSFKEDYGESQYAHQITLFETLGAQLLKPYVHVAVG